MITFPIPTKARFIPSENIFSAPFSGLYNFGIAANAGKTVIELQANTVYYLDNFTVSGNVASEDFLACISTTPTLRLYRTFDPPGSTLYARTIPISQFYQNKECTCFVTSQKGGESLLATFQGILNQNSSLVGIDPLIITISFSIYAMDDNEYNRQFRDTLDPLFSQKLRR